MIEPEQPPDLLPARMINEYVYCPRLFWLEHVEREFQESHDTIDGERIHRRVDQPRGELPEDAVDARAEATSVELSSATLGVVAKIDLVKAEDGVAMPIDFKRGKVPAIPRKAYDPERVQICVQALLLREAGYTCDVGRLYFAASKTYVDVAIDAELVELTMTAIAAARALGVRTSIPPPLLDSPKCPRCSLNSICLPDETNAIRLQRESVPVRPFAAPSNDRVPLYVLEAGARVGLSGEVLEVRTDAGVQAEVRLMEVASVSLFGAVQMSSQAMRNVLARDVPVFFLSYGGWLDGFARSVNDHSLDLRIAQHEMAKNPDASLAIARSLVFGKVKNQRTMVRRARADDGKAALQAMALLMHKIERATTSEELLGLEGLAARRYFEQFGEMLTTATGFEVTGRNRRPPTDPVNAMLSFGYAMLTKEALAAALSVGFEPGLGIYHRVRPGRPSLALDLMEEFRPLIVDSVVLSLVNTKAIRVNDFDRRGRAVILSKEGRRTFIGAIERRLRSSIMHPVFGYEVSYRRALHIQARLLARVIQCDLPAYPAFMTR